MGAAQRERIYAWILSRLLSGWCLCMSGGRKTGIESGRISLVSQAHRRCRVQATATAARRAMTRQRLIVRVKVTWTMGVKREGPIAYLHAQLRMLDGAHM